MSKVQKDYAGREFFYSVNKNFVKNATSKFARSTLTSPSTIRVKSVLNCVAVCRKNV